MLDNEDQLLDAKQWKTEAQAIINDVKDHVQNIHVSEKLDSDNCSIFLNLTTLEGFKFCILVSGSGFTITGNQHDLVLNTNNEIFETPYSLLQSISPKYCQSFGNNIIAKLGKISNNQIPND